MIYVYINVLILILKLCLQTEGIINCPTNFVQHPYYSNKCYNVSYLAAKANTHDVYCRNIGGQMVSVHNKEIQVFISNILASGLDYYIGLLWTTNPLVFTWKDSKPVLWLNLVGTPGGMDNVVYIGSNGQWAYDIDTHQKHLACDYLIGQMTDTHLALVGGNNTCGRVEVYHEGLWGTISDAHPDAAFGNFVCNQFGYDFDTFDRSCVVNQGTGKIWLDTYYCGPSALTINDCVSQWGSTVTSHNNDVYVKCKVSATTESTSQSTLTPIILNVQTTSNSCQVIYTVTETVYVPPSSSSILYNVSSLLPRYSKKAISTSYDMRPSAVAIGSAGVIALLSVFGFVISTDCYCIFKFIAHGIENLKRILRERQDSFKQLKGKNPNDYNVNMMNTEALKRAQGSPKLIPPTIPHLVEEK